MKITKKISVVMCTYNGGPYIEDQLNSIVHQTYPIHELIIQDDGSTDNTISIIRNFIDRYPYIRFFQNQEHLGINRNFFSAMARASGEFIAIADQDDIWFTNKLEKQIECIGNYDICISCYYTDPEYSYELNKLSIPTYDIEIMLFFCNTLGHTMLIRKSLLQLVELPSPVSYDYWIAVCSHSRNGIVCTKEALNWHRIHGKSATGLVNAQHDTKSRIKPYFKGIVCLNRLWHNANWKYFVTYIRDLSEKNPQMQCAHELSVALLKTNIFGLFQLCCLSFKYRKILYPGATKSFLFYIRAFCFPFIWAYHRQLNFDISSRW